MTHQQALRAKAVLDDADEEFVLERSGAEYGIEVRGHTYWSWGEFSMDYHVANEVPAGTPVLGGNEEGAVSWLTEPAQGDAEPRSGTTTRNEVAGPQNARSGRGQTAALDEWFDEWLDDCYERPIRRARLYGIALGLVVGFLAGLCTWGLWQALSNPAAWRLMEVR
jgi:hypothetical protein